MDILERARKIRKNIILASVSLDDKTASETPELFGRLNEDGGLIKAGSTINWNGTLKRASVDLWDTKENNPNNSPSLWNDISYKDGYRIIPETITVTTAFSKNEIGYWDDELYKSLVDNNVYNPEQYSTNWEKIN